MSSDKYAESDSPEDDDFEELSEDPESALEKEPVKKAGSGFNPEARRRLEEYYERKLLEQSLEDDFLMDDEDE
ncbi:MAG: hypothetical protein OEX19_12675 [Gammaproteobacteria bacterium]|nr:hypothetical protein [Gammaproteobacteria bacterium]